MHWLLLEHLPRGRVLLELYSGAEALQALFLHSPFTLLVLELVQVGAVFALSLYFILAPFKPLLCSPMAGPTKPVCGHVAPPVSLWGPAKARGCTQSTLGDPFNVWPGGLYFWIP